MADLTVLQTRILELLWERPGSTVLQLTELLRDEFDLARNSVGTIVARMVDYGWVSREKHGREYELRASVSREEVESAKVERLTSSLFRHDLSSLVSHALEARDWEAGDLERVIQLLDRHAERDRERDDG